MAMTLESSLEIQPDVILRFADDEDVPAHALILQLWSRVLGETLRATGLPQESSPVVIPMTGTLRSDWLKVAAIMYPSESDIVTWDNLKALMVLADKYDMPAIARKSATFLDAHFNELTGTDATTGSADDSRYIWDWLPLLDKAVLCGKSKHLMERCMFRAACSFRETCTAEHLTSLSYESLVLFGTTMSGTLDPAVYEKAASTTICHQCGAVGLTWNASLQTHVCRVCAASMLTS
jgi:hypothetical protein